MSAIAARAAASDGSKSFTLMELSKIPVEPVTEKMQRIGFYRDKWRGRRWSMAKQLKMANTGAFRPPPDTRLDVAIMRTGGEQSS